ncbi:restriction endonuclease subunit S [Lactococcus formosensis]|uniref:restriction endonuclease subunit S n=1 Tax=Lactococcus formosensis TaxID=1281486 RepID=UPI0024357949|nr:restriction endonuclease subunit S [Lactococcus formosensis]MDG6154636.1 restriction endonuclease subunit S [Lactococcus formosensis]MDG6184038.1 restriction endonuclease subunit S [Lactococcus formosensis]MDG6185223.1 restriction endonuclease subunit S [Lactococcus formosensis]
MNDKNLGSQKNKLKKIKKSPELRFKGFSDDWEQRKLGELGNLNRGKSKHRPRNDSRLFGGEYPFIQTGDVAKAPLFLTEYSQTYSEFGIQQSKLWDIGTLLITIAANVADTTILGIKAAFPDSVIGFESTSCDVVFIKNYIDIQSDLLKRKAETSSQANLNLAKLKEMSLNVPKLKEQQKIGSFFKQLDDTIALHQRKLDKLKQLKQGYLQKLFPKPGETVPKIRFANFEGEWEENKLAILFKKGGSGGTPKSTNPDYYGGNIPFLGISDISNSNGYIYSTEKTITSKGLENSSAWVVPKGAISLAMYASVGKLAILNIDAATSQAFYNMVFHDNKLRDFIYQRLLMANEIGEWSKLISTGTQSNLNADKVKNFNIKLPIDIKEIGKIGSIFKQLDNSITIHQNKLNQLKTCKKALLQKMFI